MLDAIRSLADLPVGEDVHLAREDVAAARCRRRLQREARRRARECVEQARRDADAVHAEAFRQGYAEGILRATAHLAEGLLTSHNLALQLRHQLAQAANELLAQALSCPQWLDEMLERWLAAQVGNASAILQAVLPLACRPRADEWRERLGRHWAGELSLEYHPQDRYVLRLADRVLEFDLETTRARLAPRLLASLADLPESVRVLDQAAWQALSDACASFAPHTTPGDPRHED
ncbi:oxygen-regulated invasion protein OrgB [Pseudomonas citrulli]|uniref:Oxygen-regulated invasion protein OrgB n=1 Tax=Pseudomonas citrulli TaxID=3064347 RepID=A0ABT9BZK5_9PSED|nr:oxygen-regulated invasion protein OrgB [Pseudomonas sp. K18]MDO7896758.1 oxygen-regulated invasion protein OrgB [Pseudomonas sp. K18]